MFRDFFGPFPPEQNELLSFSRRVLTCRNVRLVKLSVPFFFFFSSCSFFFFQLLLPDMNYDKNNRKLSCITSFRGSSVDDRKCTKTKFHFRLKRTKTLSFNINSSPTIDFSSTDEKKVTRRQETSNFVLDVSHMFSIFCNFQKMKNFFHLLALLTLLAPFQTKTLSCVFPFSFSRIRRKKHSCGSEKKMTGERKRSKNINSVEEEVAAVKTVMRFVLSLKKSPPAEPAEPS